MMWMNYNKPANEGTWEYLKLNYTIKNEYPRIYLCLYGL